MSEAQGPERQISQFAAKIKALISKPGELEMVNIMRNFRIFISNQYCEVSDRTTPKEYLDFIWQRISKEEPEAVRLIMIDVVRQIHIGTKMQRSDFLQEFVLRVPTIPDHLYWVCFEELLAWTVENSLTKRTDAFLEPFEKMMTDVPEKVKKEEVKEVERWRTMTNHLMVGMRMLCLFARRFPTFLNNNASVVVRWLQCGIVNLEVEVLVLVRDALRLLQCERVGKDKNEWPKVFMEISNYFDDLIESGGSPPGPQLQCVCEIAEILFELNSDCVKLLKFSAPLYQFLSRKEASSRNVVFAIYPFYVGSCDVEKSEEVTVATLKAFKSLIAKKMVGRNEALIGLANYLFACAPHGTLTSGETEALLSQMRKKLEMQIDSEAALYCVAALIAVTEPGCSKAYSVFENAPLSLNLVEAFRKMCEIQVNQRPFFCKKVLNECMGKLLNDHIPASEAIMAFECLNRMNVPIEKGSDSLVLQLSVWMSHPDKLLKNLATDLVLKYQEQWPSFVVFERVLAVISTEISCARRADLLKRVKKEPCDARVVAIIQSLVHDPAYAVRNESLRILSSMADIPEAASKLGEFLSEKARDMGQQAEKTKDSIECFSIVASMAFGNEKTKAARATKQLLIPLAQFLISTLLATQAASTNALKLLSQLLPLAPKAANLRQLTSLIGSTLSIHSTASRLDTAMDLFQAALDVTNLKYTIYTESLDLVIKLLDLVRNQTFSGTKFLKVLTSIGAIDPQMVRGIEEKSLSSEEDSGVSNTPNTYIANFDPNHFSAMVSKKPVEVSDDKKNADKMQNDIQPRLESLCSASVGVALLNLLDILSEEALSGLHADAIEAILKIFRAQRRQIGDSLEAELFKRFTQMIQVSGASTISVLIKNMTTLIVVLGDRFVPLVPHVVDLVCKNWGKRDMSLLTRILSWMITYLPEALEPHIPKIAMLVVKSFESSDAATLSRLFSSLDLRRYLSSIDHVIFPPLCEWLCFHPDDPGMEQLLPRFREMLIYADVCRFADQVIRATIEIQHANPKMQPKLIDILDVVISQIETQFLLYFPQIRAVFSNLDENFLALVGLLEEGLNDPEKREFFEAKLANTKRTPLLKEPTTPQGTKVSSQAHENIKIQAQMPQADWEEAQWRKWSENLFMTLMQKCGHDIRFRAIAACDSLVQRHTRIADALYPLAFSLFFFDKSADTNLDDVLQCVFSPNVIKTVPITVLRHFLSVMELIEINQNVPARMNSTGSSECNEVYVVDPSHVAQGAEQAHLIVQALRINEDLYNNSYSDERAQKAVLATQISKMIDYNQQLGLPLAAKEVLVLASQRDVDINQGLCAEKLGLWNDALETYNRTLESEPENAQAFEGKLRCLLALAKYKEIQQCTTEGKWPLYQAAAYWGMGEDANFLKIGDRLLQEKSRDHIYYTALYHMMKGLRASGKADFKEVKRLTGELRDFYAGWMFPAIGEYYDCVYTDFAAACYATEIEESIIHCRPLFHRVTDSPRLTASFRKKILVRSLFVYLFGQRRV